MYTSSASWAATRGAGRAGDAGRPSNTSTSRISDQAPAIPARRCRSRRVTRAAPSSSTNPTAVTTASGTASHSRVHRDIHCGLLATGRQRHILGGRIGPSAHRPVGARRLPTRPRELGERHQMQPGRTSRPHPEQLHVTLARPGRHPGQRAGLDQVHGRRVYQLPWLEGPRGRQHGRHQRHPGDQRGSGYHGHRPPAGRRSGSRPDHPPSHDGRHGQTAGNPPVPISPPSTQQRRRKVQHGRGDNRREAAVVAAATAVDQGRMGVRSSELPAHSSLINGEPDRAAHAHHHGQQHARQQQLRYRRRRVRHGQQPRHHVTQQRRRIGPGTCDREPAHHRQRHERRAGQPRRQAEPGCEQNNVRARAP